MEATIVKNSQLPHEDDYGAALRDGELSAGSLASAMTQFLFSAEKVYSDRVLRHYTAELHALLSLMRAATKRKRDVYRSIQALSGQQTQTTIHDGPTPMDPSIRLLGRRLYGRPSTKRYRRIRKTRRGRSPRARQRRRIRRGHHRRRQRRGVRP